MHRLIQSTCFTTHTFFPLLPLTYARDRAWVEGWSHRSNQNQPPRLGLSLPILDNSLLPHRWVYMQLHIHNSSMKDLALIISCPQLLYWNGELLSRSPIHQTTGITYSRLLLALLTQPPTTSVPFHFSFLISAHYRSSFRVYNAHNGTTLLFTKEGSAA